MHRTVIGWVIYDGRHCRRAIIFQPVPAANRTRVAGFTGKHSTTSLYPHQYGKILIGAFKQVCA